MKISPMAGPVAPVMDGSGQPQPGRLETSRTMQMRTNATPAQSQPPNLPILEEHRETEAEPAVSQPLSPQLALLAKQRRALQVRERELAAREKALQSSGQGSPGIEVARLKAEPLRVLLENGVTYDQLAQAITENPVNPEVMGLKSEMQSLKEEMTKQFTDREAAQERAVLAEMRREATQIVGTTNDYELVRVTKSVPKVMELIEARYRKTGEVLDVPEALRLVEEELFSDAQRIAALEKVRNKIVPPAPPVPQRPYQPQMRTLTNRDTASVPMSARDRALAAFYGTLKK